MRNQRAQTRATELRKQMTDAEHRLWYRIRKRQLFGYKFRRQYPIGNFIADFACIEANLIIEVDGGQHVEKRLHDERRTAFLERQGFKVLRFWNDDVLKNTDSVLESIVRELGESRLPPP